jgi:putative addiction module component (TIGR02574 family)
VGTGRRLEATTAICCEYMSGNAHAVLEQAKKLTAEERIELARELLASVDEDEEAGTPEEIEEAWDDEIRRRDEQVLAGGGGAHDAEDVLAEAEHIIRSPR